MLIRRDGAEGASDRHENSVGARERALERVRTRDLFRPVMIEPDRARAAWPGRRPHAVPQGPG
jgi:hypothetical protein